MSARILIVDDEPAIVHALRTLLAREGYLVEHTDNGADALQRLAAEPYSLLISDIYMEPVDGLELLRRALELNPRLPVIMITAYGSVDSAVQAMRQGAFDYITKPFRFAELIQTVQHALAYEQQARASAGEPRDTLSIRYYYRRLAGDSSSIRHVYAAIESVAPTPQPVLIVGEPGVGKSLVASVVHSCSGRHEGSLLTVDCAGPATDVGRQLFAERAFEQARRGSLLLENIDRLDLQLQRGWLVSRQRLGSRAEPGTEARLLLTARTDLARQVQRGQFLEELYYLLAAVLIEVPPLHARREDLPILIQHFLNELEEPAAHPFAVAVPALRAMEEYPWPGNLRELRETLVAAARTCQENLIALSDLPPALRAAVGAAAETVGGPAEYRWRSLRSFLKTKERQYLEQVLKMTAGNRQRAAEILNLSLDEFNRKYNG